MVALEHFAPEPTPIPLLWVSMWASILGETIQSVRRGGRATGTAGRGVILLLGRVVGHQPARFPQNLSFRPKHLHTLFMDV